MRYFLFYLILVYSSPIILFSIILNTHWLHFISKEWFRWTNIHIIPEVGEKRTAVRELPRKGWEHSRKSRSLQVSIWSDLHQYSQHLRAREKKLHTFFYCLKDWLHKTIGLQINKTRCLNKIVLFFQEILKHFTHHRRVF